MSLIKKINEILKKIFNEFDYEVDGTIVKVSDRPDLSQFQCNEAFNLAKKYRKNPRAIAEEIVNELNKNGIFKEVSVDGPGFINISLKEEFLASYIEENFSSMYVAKKSSFKDILIKPGPSTDTSLKISFLFNSFTICSAIALGFFLYTLAKLKASLHWNWDKSGLSDTLIITPSTLYPHSLNSFIKISFSSFIKDISS